MHGIRLMGGVLIAALSAGPLAAQADACGLRAITAERPAGSYADYAMSGPGGDGTLRMIFLGTEKQNNAKMERMELQFTNTRMGGGQMVMQMLVPRWPFQMDEVGEMIMQAPGRPPMRMPTQMLQMAGQRAGQNPAMGVNKVCRDAKLVGSEKLSVAAGSFQTKHYRNEAESADLWVSTDLAGWGLVKSVTAGTTLELRAIGKDGKTALQGVPIDMPAMGGPPPGARRP